MAYSADAAWQKKKKLESLGKQKPSLSGFNLLLLSSAYSLAIHAESAPGLSGWYQEVTLSCQHGAHWREGISPAVINSIPADKIVPALIDQFKKVCDKHDLVVAAPPNPVELWAPWAGYGKALPDNYIPVPESLYYGNYPSLPAYAYPPIYTQWTFSQENSTLSALKKIIPNLLEEKALCPECGWGDRSNVVGIVVHLNDAHKWTREAIAAWGRTLDCKLKVRPPSEQEEETEDAPSPEAVVQAESVPGPQLSAGYTAGLGKQWYGFLNKYQGQLAAGTPGGDGDGS